MNRQTLCIGLVLLVATIFSVWVVTWNPLVHRQLLGCQHVIDTKNDISGLQNAVSPMDLWPLSLGKTVAGVDH